MGELRVTNIRKEFPSGSQTLSADFVIGRGIMTVWFRVNGNDLSESADPFVPVALIPAMRRNWSLVVDGDVSPMLLEGAASIQTTMAGWYPNYHQVPVRATGAAPQRRGGRRSVATFFSGGVDSFYTLQQHRDEISHLVFVHGFDVPLRFVRERQRIVQSIRSVADSLQLSLVEVETNLRQFGQPHVHWQHAYYGAGLAAVALLLEPQFDRIYLRATNSADQLEPTGSHPDTDPKWSNGSIEIVHDGLFASRLEKVRSIVEWAPVLSQLRVCYQRNDEELNCGRCRKCLWTMMLLRAAGYLHKATTFGEPLDLEALQLYPPASRYERDRFEQAIALLEAHDADPQLRAVMRTMLDAKGRLPVKGQIVRLLARGRNYLAHRLPDTGFRR